MDLQTAIANYPAAISALKSELALCLSNDNQARADQLISIIYRSTEAVETARAVQRNIETGGMEFLLGADSEMNTQNLDDAIARADEADTRFEWPAKMAAIELIFEINA